MKNNSLTITYDKFSIENDFVIKVLFALFFISEALVFYLVLFEKTKILLLLVALIAMLIIVVKPLYGLYITTIVAISGIASNLLQGMYLSLILLTTVVWILYFLINKKKSLVSAPQNILWILLGILMLFSSCYASDIYVSYLYLYAYIKYLLLYFLIINMLDSWKSIRSLMWLLTITGLFMFFYGVYASFFASADKPIMRMISFVEDPNSFAIKLMPLVAFSYILIKTEKLRILKIVALILLISLILSIILTFSRGGMIALFIMLSFIGFKEIKHKRNIFFIVMFILLLLLIIPQELMFFRIGTITNINLDASIIQRVKILKGALRMFLDHPIWGVGAGNFITHSKIYCGTILGRVAHNSFLHVAAENGIIGLLLFSSILALTFKNLIYCCKNLTNSKYYYYPLGIIYALLGFLIHSLFLSEQFNVVLFILIGLTVIINNMVKLSES